MTKKVTITMPLCVAETLHGLVDGCIGSSEDELFSEEMDIVRKNLAKEISKHYKPKNNDNIQKSKGG